MTELAADASNRTSQVRRALVLEYITFAYTGLEAIMGVFAGWTAGSVALLAFGVDSAIELISALALLWRLHHDEAEQRGRTEALGLRIVGACFLALAAYIASESAVALLRKEAPEHTIIGIVLVGGAVVLMPILARTKRTVNRTIGSPALRADANQSDHCAYLSGITLAGLVLNMSLGWWWADPLAALAMLPIILRDGVEALRGRECACCSGEQ